MTILSEIMLSVIIHGVIMLSVIMPSVVAPKKMHTSASFNSLYNFIFTETKHFYDPSLMFEWNTWMKMC
jgi:hypothetical protein